MTFLPLLGLTLATAASSASDPVAAAIREAILANAPSGVTRVEVASHRDRLPQGCAVSEARPLGEVFGSGEITLKLEGRAHGESCAGWSWAQTKLFSRALVTTRRLTTGEALAGGFEVRERELLAGHSLVIDAASDAVAAYTLPSGQTLELQNVRSPAQMPGRIVPVELRDGDLIVQTQGRTVPCTANAACALLPSGKQVAGKWINGRLEVSLP